MKSRWHQLKTASRCNRVPWGAGGLLPSHSKVKKCERQSLITRVFLSLSRTRRISENVVTSWIALVTEAWWSFLSWFCLNKKDLKLWYLNYISGLHKDQVVFREFTGRLRNANIFTQYPKQIEVFWGVRMLSVCRKKYFTWTTWV